MTTTRLPRRPFLARRAAVLALAAATVLAPLAPSAFAQPAANDTAVPAALAEFQRALGGQRSAIEPAATQLLALSKAEPANPVLRAYAGAATAMRASTTMLPWKKMDHAEDGLALIDKALSQLTPAHDAPMYRHVPASLEVRFTAAGTFLALPAMFNRQERGLKLLDEVAKSPLIAAAPPPFQGLVWMRAGQEAAKAQHTAEAREWFQKVSASGAPQAPAAQARLKDL
jgi:hypothetical protein